MTNLTSQQKAKIKREAKAAADYLTNGIHRGGSWVRVCLIYKGSDWSPTKSGVGRLVDALLIHFNGTGFASKDIGAHYEIACSNAGAAKLAREYIDGWIANSSEGG